MSIQCMNPRLTLCFESRASFVVPMAKGWWTDDLIGLYTYLGTRHTEGSAYYDPIGQSTS